MIAIHGIEGANLKPAGEKVWRGGAAKSADVIADERYATEAKIKKHLSAQAELIPSGGVVPGPGKSVALAAGIGGTGQNEGALVRAKLQEPFVGGALIFHAKDVVNLCVGGGAGSEAWLIDAMDAIEGHGSGGTVEYRGFVHVIPEAGNAVLNELLVEAAPPCASLGTSEVGEDRRAWPDDADEFAAVRIFYEVVACVTGVVRCVSLIGDVGDVEICDGDQMKMLFVEISDETREVRKCDGIDGERTVPVLVVDVEIYSVRRNLIRPQACGDLAQLGFGSVAVTRLLESEGPQRRKRRRAGEVDIAFYYLLWGGAIDEVVVEGAALGTEGVCVASLFAEVEPGAPCIV